MINYTTEKRKRLKTAKNGENKKAVRVNTPPKTFSFQPLSDFPRLLLNGCKDIYYTISPPVIQKSVSPSK